MAADAEPARAASMTREAIVDELEECERKAWDGLSRGQFWIFGFYAGRWAATMQLWRRATGEAIKSPFRPVVEEARRRYCITCEQVRAWDHVCTGPRR